MHLSVVRCILAVFRTWTVWGAWIWIGRQLDAQAYWIPFGVSIC